MDNRFYTDFDVATLGVRSTQDPYRSPFQQDRDRIIHSSAFRRLQAKTQVFRSGEYDFYRTRLTHSLEVAQIGRGICNYLRKRGEVLSGDFFVDEDLVEACCLAHDIGHPPFGHAGEATLNHLMQPYGGFEGNAQTLRLVTETIYSNGAGREGMKPTRAFLDGILKYKRGWEAGLKNHFVYRDQGRYLEFVADGEQGSPATTRKSLECQIMDWADDIAYCLGDLTDGVRARFLSHQNCQEWGRRNEELVQQAPEAFGRFLQAMERKEMGRFAAGKIGEFLRAITLREVDTPLNDRTNRYRYELQIAPEVKAQSKLLKKLAVDLIFRTPQIQQLEAKGDLMLRQMFSAYAEHYWSPRRHEEEGLRILSSEADAYVRATPREDAEKRARLVCDYIAGMSDDFAIRTYERLFMPRTGSIVDLV